MDQSDREATVAPDDKSRHSLGQSLYALRRDASSADVVVGTTVLHLNPDVVSCDAWELDAAHRKGDFSLAVELYAGPYLDAINLRGSAELQQTIDAERVRLAIVHADAIESPARAAAHRGGTHEAAQLWRRLAAADPFSSRVALELVRALVADGDKTGALKAARVREALVREHLEVAPDSSFIAFTEALRREVASAPALPVTAPVAATTHAASPDSAAAVSVPNVEPRASRAPGLVASRG